MLKVTIKVTVKFVTEKM